MTYRLLICHILILLANSYMIDENNYFYINSSFHKETVSFSMCFHFNQPATVQIQSPLLVPMENHITVGQFKDEISGKFTPPFDSELVGYNNYDSGEYWLGVKFRQENEVRKGTFQKVKMEVKIGQKIYNYIFMAPLFRMPLNAFQISPTNTLYKFSDWLLISYLHKLKEVDAYIFRKTSNTNTCKLLQKGDWGFTNEDSNINYQRYKSKKSNQITVEITVDQMKVQTQLTPAHKNEMIELENNKNRFTFEDLVLLASQLGLSEPEL